MTQTRTIVVLASSNSKTGKVAATYRTQHSCPTTCALYDAGCYARGRIFGIAAKNGHEVNGDYAAVLGLIDTMPPDYVLRANVSGDFLSEDGSPDLQYITALNTVADARPDVTIIAYTHAWRTLAPGMFRFVVNASCDTPADVIEARAAGWATVVVDTNADDTLVGSKLSDSRVIQCPNQTRGITCAECKLCGRERPATVAFAVHGAGKNQAVASLRSHRAA